MARPRWLLVEYEDRPYALDFRLLKVFRVLSDRIDSTPVSLSFVEMLNTAQEITRAEAFELAQRLGKRGW